VEHFIRLVGPNQAVKIYGVKLVGVTTENGKKLLFSVVFIVIVWLLTRVARAFMRSVVYGYHRERVRFWTHQGISLASAIVLILGMVSIWFDDPTRLTTAVGLVTAGLAFALQKVVTAVAGYFVILRGKTFNVGDRIRMGGVRGDVIALGFMQTTIMEMGQPPDMQSDEPAMWVQSRQYTGRVVTVTNAQIFDEPVYNYTRDFPYIWEEIHLPVKYGADRNRAEQILLEAAARHTIRTEQLSHEALDEMKRRYFLEQGEVAPRVYYRLTDNWIELTVRFVVREHGIRAAKDAISRDILSAMEEAGLEVASATYDIIGMPALRVQNTPLEPRGTRVMDGNRR
jgi:small-conductance mechanosensitive channel